MSLSILLHAFSADFVLAARTMLRFVHFVGLALGLGGATVLDLMLIRFFISDRITPEKWIVFRFVSTLVNIGLLLLWVTGLGFLLHYVLFDPVKLTNDKIWAKLAIVWVLSVNGLFIHAVVLPRIEQQIGRPLFSSMGKWQRRTFLASGAVSAVSWYVPVALGALVQFNFTVPASAILTVYAMVLGVTVVAVNLVVYAFPGVSSRWRAWGSSLQRRFGLA